MSFEEQAYAFWEKAFLAAISGCDGGRPDEVVGYAGRVAEEAVALWAQAYKAAAEAEAGMPNG